MLWVHVTNCKCVFAFVWIFFRGFPEGVVHFQKQRFYFYALPCFLFFFSLSLFDVLEPLRGGLSFVNSAMCVFVCLGIDAVLEFYELLEREWPCLFRAVLHPHDVAGFFFRCSFLRAPSRQTLSLK